MRNSFLEDAITPDNQVRFIDAFVGLTLFGVAFYSVEINRVANATI